MCNNDSSLYTKNSPTPTQILSQPEECSKFGRFGYAAATILPTINMNDKNALTWGILDSGATSHFLISDAPVDNKKVCKNPLKVQLPDGHSVASSHKGELALHYLPKAARKAYVVPGLARHSLISVVKLCNGGCDVRVSDVSCTIWYKGKY